MFPIGDDNSARRLVPVVMYTLITINVLFFLVKLIAGDDFVTLRAFAPSRFMADPETGGCSVA